MAREIVTSENREEYINKKMNPNADKNPKDVKHISEKYKEHGVISDVYSGKNAIELSRIIVPKEKRGEGIGSKFMSDLIAHADKHEKRIDLSPSKDFGASSIDRLKTFYKKHGFVENKGKHKDYSISHSMYRHPVKSDKE